MISRFPHLRAVVQDGINRQLHTGVQAYASIDGNVVLDDGFGESSPGIAMTPSTIMLWRSAGKPLTAVAILQLVEDAQLTLDQKVCDILADCDTTPAGQSTFTELLTHTSAIPVQLTDWPNTSESEIVKLTLQATTGNPSKSAAYQPQTTWFVLGEILRTKTESGSFSHAIRQQLLAPFCLNEVWCGIPPTEIRELESRLPTLYERVKGRLIVSDYSRGEWLAQPSPGGNFRGPIRKLGRFYELLAQTRQAESDLKILSPKTIAQMVERHRKDTFDHTLQHVVDYGLGLIINSNRHGEATVPYGFGRYCSANTFGHGGAQCSMGFCDPAGGLVVAWAANGFCGEGQHQRRNRSMNEAIYKDLGFA